MVQIACICPPRADGTTRHPDGDRVDLREQLDFRAAASIRNAIFQARQEDPGTSGGDLMAVMGEAFILNGVQSWTLVDKQNKAIEVTRPAIREHLLTHPVAAMTISDAATELYYENQIAPLVNPVPTSSPSSRTGASTSATSGQPPKRPKPSKPSSTSTTRTDGIAPMQ